MPTPKSILAEFIGTFALMFVGGGAIILHPTNILVIACAHGLILGVMVCAVMHISGGQFNPSVSFALVVAKKQSPAQAIAFIFAQCAGSIFAAFLLSTLLSGTSGIEVGNLGATLGKFSTGADANPMKVVVLEGIATFFLMYVIMGSAVDCKSKTTAAAGFAIGLTITADILFFGPLTGASMNPARSLGPALIGGHWEMHWAYWVAPIIGASAAAIAHCFPDPKE